jgi:hypothetical protein
MSLKDRCGMPKKESITVKGSQLVQAVRDLIRQNDEGKICISYEKRRLLEIPFLAGDPSAPANVLKGPLLAALNAFGALADECTIDVESREKKEKKK